MMNSLLTVSWPSPLPVCCCFAPACSRSLLARAFPAKACPGLDPGWRLVRVKKTRQIRNLESCLDSIKTEGASARSAPLSPLMVLDVAAAWMRAPAVAHQRIRKRPGTIPGAGPVRLTDRFISWSWKNPSWSDDPARIRTLLAPSTSSRSASCGPERIQTRLDPSM